ncbi:retrovirus-related Pol polyprotein from transposon 297 [Trichonephila clavipes]|nr:retrovirus-related Pol polyprotein from transposon 297 [Trichonephila clavipes]
MNGIARIIRMPDDNTVKKDTSVQTQYDMEAWKTKAEICTVLERFPATQLKSRLLFVDRITAFLCTRAPLKYWDVLSLVIAPATFDTVRTHTPPTNRIKEDLINVLKEIGEQATSKETIIELKTKLEKSAAFKDDPDFVINLLNLSVEDRQAKAERQLQETNSQLDGIRDKVQTLIENYCPNKTETTALKMKIILSDEKPIAQRSRRLSLPEKREVEKQIDEWLEQGIIRESCSDFSSPVVVCKKKDGTMRVCIDYRKLNKKIVKDRYPLPIIEEVLDKLGNGKIFTTLDLKNAFFHVDVDEASRKYTAFVTETGQYEFLKVPFGLSISSNYFQRYINYVFRELLRDGTLIIYLDDIIIPATDEKEACKN